MLVCKQDHGINVFDQWQRMHTRVGSEYFQSTRVRVLSTSEVLEYEYEYFSPFYKSTRVRVQSTQNVLMNILMSTLGVNLFIVMLCKHETRGFTCPT